MWSDLGSVNGLPDHELSSAHVSHDEVAPDASLLADPTMHAKADWCDLPNQHESSAISSFPPSRVVVEGEALSGQRTSHRSMASADVIRREGGEHVV
jgi:hypothetical protein